MTERSPIIRPMRFCCNLSDPASTAWVCSGETTRGYDMVTRARYAANSMHHAFGIWRPSRRRALVETLNSLLWPQSVLARAVRDQTIYVQFSAGAFNIPILADAMGMTEPELWVVLARMDGFRINRLIMVQPHIEFNFPAHWAPFAFGDKKPYCPTCRNTGVEDWSHLGINPCDCSRAVWTLTGVEDWSHLGINPCDCSRAVWTLTGGDWPDAPLPQPLAAKATPAGRTAPAPDKSGPGPITPFPTSQTGETHG